MFHIFHRYRQRENICADYDTRELSQNCAVKICVKKCWQTYINSLAVSVSVIYN